MADVTRGESGDWGQMRRKDWGGIRREEEGGGRRHWEETRQDLVTDYTAG